MLSNDKPNLIRLSVGRLSAVFTPVGAAVASLRREMEEGGSRQLLLSPLSHFDGEPEPCRAGCTVGPCCGRVRGGEMTLDGRTYALDLNENGNHLHGGFRGAADRRWEVVEETGASVAFSLLLPDGEGGYPGNRRLTARYALEEDALRVAYSATTDAPTWLCLTNHAYWDLTGRFDGSAMSQALEVPASRVVFNDERHLPVAIQPAEGTPFDFRAPASPAAQLARHPHHPQTEIARGFNNALLLDADAPFAARLTAPDGRLSMTLTTDYPSLVFYSGGFLGAKTRLEGGPAVPGAALALEAQDLPDPFHLPGAVPTVLRPGEIWHRFIRWEFNRG